MKKKLFTLVVLLVFTGATKIFSQVEKSSKKPNIILIMCDDLGFGDTGFNGNEIIQTPSLDMMANEGVNLTNFHAGGPVCSPTRFTFITGRHYARSNVVTANAGHISTNEITISEIAKSKGYTTGHFGKWHLGTLSKEFSAKGAKREPEKNFSPPWLHGYDKTFVCESANATWNPTQHSRYKNNPYWEDKEIATENLEGSSSRIIMDRAIPFIENAVDNNKPFLSVIWFNAPHAPVLAGPEHRALYKDYPESAQHYYGCVTAVDEQVGRLRDYLISTGEYNNTLILFCSDNGPEGEKLLETADATKMKQEKIDYGTNYWGTTNGLRGRKRAIFEGGIRVPAFAVWGNNLNKGTVSNSPLSTLDYLPTIAAILDYEMPDARPIDGEDMLSLIADTSNIRANPIPIWFKGAKFTTKSGNKSPVFGLITVDNFKYQFNLESQLKGEKQNTEEGVYDLSIDKGEDNNIISTKEEELKKYKNYLNNWWKSAFNSKNGNDFN